MKIILPAYSNLRDFEKLMLSHLQKSKKAREVDVDLTNIQWIGVLQLSLLAGWLNSLILAEKKVRLILPASSEHNDAIKFMSRINFFQELERMNVEIIGNCLAVETKGLSAFKFFKNTDELTSYKNKMDAPETIERLLGGGGDIDVVRDGDLKDIILHELGENAFIHGDGKYVRYAIAEYRSSTGRGEHKVLSDFNGSSFVEIVVSDSGTGLLKILAEHTPDNYDPEVDIVAKKLAKEAITILYAFEFNSTSDLNGRKKRITSILKGGKDVTEAVPTGLYYVSELCKEYGGQLIVRTASILVSLDYSRPISARALVTSMTKLASIDGTHILVRLPRNRGIVQPRFGLKPFLKNISIQKTLSLALGNLKLATSSDEEFIVRAEREIFELINTAANKNVPVVALLCDGLHVDTKTFSLLLITLSIIPRRDRALLLFGVKRDLLESALLQWKMIQEIRKTKSRLLDRVHGYRSFILVSEELSKVAEFGDQSHQDSTVIVDEPKSHLEFTEKSFSVIYEKIIIDEMQKIIEKEPVKHPNKYYLIEGKYYTKTFYEISKMVMHPIGHDLAMKYMQIIIEKNEIDTIFTISEPLYEFADLIEKNNAQIKCFKRGNSDRSAYFAAEGSIGKNKKLLIITDVMCRGDEVQKYLSMTRNPDNIVVACFVDGRQEDFAYLTVRTEEKPYKVSVIAIYKTKIQPIDDLPVGTDFSNVLVVDRKTHAPTLYDLITAPDVKTPKLIEIAFKNNAIYHGHYHFEGKHYSDFLYFARLFNGMRSDLYKWWDVTFEKLYRMRATDQDISVLYLDEQRGWERLVVDYMATKKIEICRPISKVQLLAPPQPQESEKRKIIWFILPVIAYGDTARLCLEYGSKFGPDRIHISIVLARMDYKRLTFYQNVAKYRDCLVEINTLSVFPIVAYPSVSSCPMCDAVKSIERVLYDTEDYDYLFELVRSRMEIFKVRDLSLENLQTKENIGGSEKDKVQLYLKVLYSEAVRSYEHRKELGALLDEPNSLAYFIDMVGSTWGAFQFTEEEIKTVTYTRFDALRKTAEDAMHNAISNDLSLSMLLGVHQLFPNLLADYIGQLFSAAIEAGHRRLSEDVAFLALLSPERYGLTIVGNPSINCKTDWAIRLVSDMRKYPYWYGKESNIALVEYLKLLWLLKRSTPWGSNIEYLKSVIQIADIGIENIRKTYHVFDSQGYIAVQQLLHKLKSREVIQPGGLWSAIQTEGLDFEHTVEKMQAYHDQIAILINENNLAKREELLKTVKELDNCGKELVQYLEKLFSNPIDSKIKILEMKESAWQRIINIRFNIEPNQPGILFGLEDLILSLSSYIDNADKCINEYINSGGKQADRFWLEFNFTGYTKDKNSSAMYIRDNLPWSSNIEPSGGLKQFMQYCKKYGALFDYSAQARDEHIKITVVFRIKDRRERYAQQ